MTSYLIDINVWLAMTWDRHPQHAAARWYQSTDRVAFWFCRFTMLGFIRLLTNRQVMGGSTVALGAAFGLYDRWKQDPRVGLVAEPPGMETLFRQAATPFAKPAASKAVADCYLVGFAEASGAQVVTFDRGLARTAKLREVPVTLLGAVVNAL